MSFWELGGEYQAFKTPGQVMLYQRIGGNGSHCFPALHLGFICKANAIWDM